MRTETPVYFDVKCSLPFFSTVTKIIKCRYISAELIVAYMAKKLEVSQFIKYKLKKYLLTCPELAASLT